MSKKVLTVYFDSNVRKAIEVMAENNIASVVVVDNSGPRGIFAERDLLSKVVGRSRRPENPIVMEVMSTLLVPIQPDKTLSEAAKTMAAKKDRLMVFEDGDIVGIVTPTDIVREIYRFGKTCDISNFIKKNPITVSSDTSVESVVREMDQKRIGSVIVLRDDVPKGIFTERDLLRSVLIPNLELSTKVGDLASTRLIAAQVGIDGREAAGIMLANRIKRLPLLDREALFAIVTARDLVDALAASVA